MANHFFVVSIDELYEPWGDGGIEQEERDSIERFGGDGSLEAYSLWMYYTHDSDCKDPRCPHNEIVDSLHGIVVTPHGDLEGSWYDPKNIPEPYIRSIATSGMDLEVASGYGTARH